MGAVGTSPGVKRDQHEGMQYNSDDCVDQWIRGKRFVASLYVNIERQRTKNERCNAEARTSWPTKIVALEL